MRRAPRPMSGRPSLLSLIIRPVARFTLALTRLILRQLHAGNEPRRSPSSMDLTHASRVNEPHACWARVQLRSRADFSKWHVVQADATAPRDNGMVYLCVSYDGIQRRFVRPVPIGIRQKDLLQSWLND